MTDKDTENLPIQQEKRFKKKPDILCEIEILRRTQKSYIIQVFVGYPKY